MINACLSAAAYKPIPFVKFLAYLKEQHPYATKNLWYVLMSVAEVLTAIKFNSEKFSICYMYKYNNLKITVAYLTVK